MNIHELEQELAATRAEVDRTLHTLAVRLSPRTQLRSAVRTAQTGAREGTRASMNWIKAHPGTAAAIGAGLLAVLGFLPLQRYRAHRSE